MTAALPVARAIAVALTIPDNAALTALATLQRLGIELGNLERADLYRVRLSPGDESAALAALRDVEALYNPNKHRWTVRTSNAPEAGELWVADGAAVAGPAVFGRRVDGVASFEAFVAWRLRAPDGAPAGPDLLRRAAETLLCNFAFQRIES